MEKMRFIRVHGRVVPLRSGKSKKAIQNSKNDIERSDTVKKVGAAVAGFGAVAFVFGKGAQNGIKKGLEHTVGNPHAMKAMINHGQDINQAFKSAAKIKNFGKKALIFGGVAAAAGMIGGAMAKKQLFKNLKKKK